MSLFGFWRGRTHNLSRMDMGDLVKAFFTYPAVHAYFGLAAIGLYAAWRWSGPLLPLAFSAIAAILIYPLAWYLLHRWVLHGQYLYKSPLTAKVWKRIHFDHHQDPHNLVVLFGALYTTIPTLILVTWPIGWALAGAPGAAIAFAAGLLSTCFYEFCHCVQHLNTAPKTAFMKRLKQLHLAHHFHNEQGNFGITNFLWDRLFGTYYAKPGDVPKSETVFNIGYTAAMAEKYPWVNILSNFSRGDGNPRRFRQKAETDSATPQS